MSSRAWQSAAFNATATEAGAKAVSSARNSYGPSGDGSRTRYVPSGPDDDAATTRSPERIVMATPGSGMLPDVMVPATAHGAGAGPGWAGAAACPCGGARTYAARRNSGSTLFDQTRGL